MAGRDSLDRSDIRPMALGVLEEGEQLGGLRRCAKDHAPYGKVDFNGHPHCLVPRLRRGCSG
jgi:hypothetical protein